MEHGSSSSKPSTCPSLEVQTCEQTRELAVVLTGPFNLGSLLHRCDGDIQLVNCVLHSFCEQGQHHLASIQSIMAGAHDNENQTISFNAVGGFHRDMNYSAKVYCQESFTHSAADLLGDPEII
jgi:hypothetical protein